MSDSEIRRRLAAPGVFAQAVKYWPLALALFAIIVAGVEARVQIARTAEDLAKVARQLEADAANVNQWRKITSNGDALVNHEARLQAVERHVTPEAIQRWGWAQEAIRANTLNLAEHRRREH